MEAWTGWKTSVSFIRALKQQKGKDIWLIGGGEINTLLLNAGLIDELELFVMPVILPEGIGLFRGFPEHTGLRLLKTQSFASGAVRMTYQVKNQNDAKNQ